MQDNCDSGAAFNDLIDSDAAVTFIKDCTYCTPLSVTGNVSDYSILVYPNPFDTEITITSKAIQPIEVKIYDAFSRLIQQKTFSGNVHVDTSNMASGIYFYKISDSNSITKKGKIIKR